MASEAPIPANPRNRAITFDGSSTWVGIGALGVVRAYVERVVTVPRGWDTVPAIGGTRFGRVGVVSIIRASVERGAATVARGWDVASVAADVAFGWFGVASRAAIARAAAVAAALRGAASRVAGHAGSASEAPTPTVVDAAECSGSERLDTGASTGSPTSTK